MEGKAQIFDFPYTFLILKIGDAAAAFIISSCQISDPVQQIEVDIFRLEPYQLFLELCLKVRIRLYIKLIRQIETVPRISGQRPVPVSKVSLCR